MFKTNIQFSIPSTARVYNHVCTALKLDDTRASSTQSSTFSQQYPLHGYISQTTSTVNPVTKRDHTVLCKRITESDSVRLQTSLASQQTTLQTRRYARPSYPLDRDRDQEHAQLNTRPQAKIFDSPTQSAHFCHVQYGTVQKALTQLFVYLDCWPWHEDSRTCIGC